PDSFRFTDKEWDALTGLIYFGARYYDAELGTWLSVDPLALWGDDGSLSPFDLNATAYVGGRVTIAVDEFGFEGRYKLFGALRAIGGIAQAAVGGALIMSGAGTGVGAYLVYRGADNLVAGVDGFVNNRPGQGITSRGVAYAAELAGAEHGAAQRLGGY